MNSFHPAGIKTSQHVCSKKRTLTLDTNFVDNSIFVDNVTYVVLIMYLCRKRGYYCTSILHKIQLYNVPTRSRIIVVGTTWHTAGSLLVSVVILTNIGRPRRRLD